MISWDNNGNVMGFKKGDVLWDSNGDMMDSNVF